ncbi:acyl-CoA/acyl-ACP dehydrogenase [Streptacidiphilus sp. 4-A2]|nr:acyl-CoA/acyl-ACP dehydrogenase [Streptacidiphilus sp. 4-A2]
MLSSSSPRSPWGESSDSSDLFDGIHLPRSLRRRLHGRPAARSGSPLAAHPRRGRRNRGRARRRPGRQAAELSRPRTRRAGEIGALGVQVPVSNGGLGFNDRTAALVVERVARACASTAAVLMFHYQVVRRALMHGATPRCDEDLSAFAIGKSIGASAWTEPNSGKGKKNVSTRLECTAEGWLLTGEKTFCTGLPGAGVVHVLAQAQFPDGRQGPTFVRVDTKLPGVAVGNSYPLLGLRGSGTGTLELHGVPVGEEDLVGGVGEGGRLMQENHQVCLNPGLLALGRPQQPSRPRISCAGRSTGGTRPDRERERPVAAGPVLGGPGIGISLRCSRNRRPGKPDGPRGHRKVQAGRHRCGRTHQPSADEGRGLPRLQCRLPDRAAFS